MSTITSPPSPSALTSLISASGSSDPISALTTQILHNLKHQHLWTSLQIHQLPSTTDQDASIPLISGIPPNRLYTHPDEQLWMLENNLRDDDIGPERFFVLPTTRGQKFTLRKLAGVFDSLPEVEEDERPLLTQVTDDQKTKDKAEKLSAYYERRKQMSKTQEWGGKRLLLAMVDRGVGGDGTVVYYVIQEGTVKPRQN
ncbi:hypothetical protein C8Q69DRAFT_149397 [Paecilomyces variotii]|uniref:tRNA-splicing endonuclease subunit Sen15 domain-containing protein n=1 Tax=Byssochlamys spectabilis TaxID=264951 RepID=A0A443I147_BYSSP|nr:hypothetical protein C8Q69DRAFT_149397 [Paecilomyces variotii]KAJ9247875.1 hypothetical protein DTO207G8_7768 [Paecilomyces variotii]KAJ9348790.1 hypothetical protein DTO027B9_8020 [Paecilomyces variotii]KAJ9365322.1 hypothetical protein DTO280E4_977 [Paecilomyces variotii]KAJ9377330.1 hypothetical protein DTO063F5_8335 [Paecilomyces variotii]RWQ97783.1 hypothetical protein C8Q69DRAFT_149397 [Paecilomyces variotii]